MFLQEEEKKRKIKEKERKKREKQRLKEEKKKKKAQENLKKEKAKQQNLPNKNVEDTMKNNAKVIQSGNMKIKVKKQTAAEEDTVGKTDDNRDIQEKDNNVEEIITEPDQVEEIIAEPDLEEDEEEDEEDDEFTKKAKEYALKVKRENEEMRKKQQEEKKKQTVKATTETHDKVIDTADNEENIDVPRKDGTKNEVVKNDNEETKKNLTREELIARNKQADEEYDRKIAERDSIPEATDEDMRQVDVNVLGDCPHADNTAGSKLPRSEECVLRILELSKPPAAGGLVDEAGTADSDVDREKILHTEL